MRNLKEQNLGGNRSEGNLKKSAELGEASRPGGIARHEELGETWRKSRGIWRKSDELVRKSKSEGTARLGEIITSRI